MNVDFNDPEVIKAGRRFRQLQAERRESEDRARKDWKWTACNSCGLVSCMCGYKEVQMLHEEYEDG